MSVSAKRILRTITRSLALGLLVLSLTSGPAAAGKPGGSSTPQGSCSVEPNPVAVGADWTITGIGLGAYTITNLQIKDSMGTSSWNLQADASGMVRLTWHSYWAGTSTATFYSSGRKATVLARCTFSVY